MQNYSDDNPFAKPEYSSDNPFVKGEYSGDNPFAQGLDDEEDNVAEIFGKRAVQGAAAANQGLMATLGNISRYGIMNPTTGVTIGGNPTTPKRYLTEILAEKLTGLISRFEPNFGAEKSLGEKVASGAGTVTGFIGGSLPLGNAVSAGTKLIGGAGLAARSAAIAKAVQGTRTGLGASIAGQVAGQLPAAGIESLAFQGLTDPGSLENAYGWSQVGLGTALGGLVAGTLRARQLTKQVAAAKDLDELAKIHEEIIATKIEKPELPSEVEFGQLPNRFQAAVRRFTAKMDEAEEAARKRALELVEAKVKDPRIVEGSPPPDPLQEAGISGQFQRVLQNQEDATKIIPATDKDASLFGNVDRRAASRLRIDMPDKESKIILDDTYLGRTHEVNIREPGVRPDVGLTGTDGQPILSRQAEIARMRDMLDNAKKFVLRQLQLKGSKIPSLSSVHEGIDQPRDLFQTGVTPVELDDFFKKIDEIEGIENYLDAIDAGKVPGGGVRISDIPLPQWIREGTELADDGMEIGFKYRGKDLAQRLKQEAENAKNATEKALKNLKENPPSAKIPYADATGKPVGSLVTTGKGKNAQVAWAPNKLVPRTAAQEIDAAQRSPALQALIDKAQGTGPVKATPGTILDRIDMTGDKAPPKTMRERWNDFIFKRVDKTNPFKVARDQLASGKPVDVSKDPYSLARLLAGSEGRQELFLDHQPFIPTPDGNVQFVGRSAKDILAQLTPEQLNQFREVSVAAHVLDPGVIERGVNTGIPIELAQKTLATADPVVLKAAQEMVQYRDHVLSYMQSKGLLSQSAQETWRKLYSNYVSFARVFDEAGESVGSTNVGDVPSRVKRFGVTVQDQLKRLTGSQRKIKDPIFTTVDQTRRGIRAADRNEVGLKLIQLAQENPEQTSGLIRLIEDTATEQTAKTIFAQAKSLIKEAADAGVDVNIEDALELTVKLNGGLTEGNNILHVWNNGYIQKYLLSPELAAAYQALDSKQLDDIILLMGLPARGLRAGVTNNPVFATFNAIRDTYDASLQSKYGFRLGIDSFKGFVESLKQYGIVSKFLGDAKYRKEWLAGGGGLSGVTSYKARSQDAAIRSIIPQTAGQKFASVVLHPMEAIKELGKPFEEAARLGEFMRGRAKQASVMEAALASRNVTTDFSRIGANMSAMAHITAFMNPAIQSFATNAESLARDPKGLFVKALGGITVPSMILWAVNRDDQEINDLRKTEAGSTFWFYRLPDGTIAKTPKPFIYGSIFGTGIETALDQMMEKDPNAMNRWAQDIVDRSKVTVVPTSVQILAGWWGNKDWFTGMPITPARQNGLDAGVMGDARTSSLARRIAGTASRLSNGEVQIDPYQLDYFIRSVGGSLAKDVTHSFDDALKTSDMPGMSRGKSETPFIGRFFADYPTKNIQPIRDFYAEYDRLGRISRTLSYVENNAPQLFEQELVKAGKDFEMVGLWNETKAQLDDIQQSINEINALPDDAVSPEEKRRITGQFITQMADLTRGVLEARQSALAGK